MVVGKCHDLMAVPEFTSQPEFTGPGVHRAVVDACGAGGDELRAWIGHDLSLLVLSEAGYGRMAVIAVGK